MPSSRVERRSDRLGRPRENWGRRYRLTRTRLALFALTEGRVEISGRDLFDRTPAISAWRSPKGSAGQTDEMTATGSASNPVIPQPKRPGLCPRSRSRTAHERERSRGFSFTPPPTHVSDCGRVDDIRQCSSACVMPSPALAARELECCGSVKWRLALRCPIPDPRLLTLMKLTDDVSSQRMLARVPVRPSTCPGPGFAPHTPPAD